MRLARLGLLALAPLLAGESGRVELVGGTLPELKNGTGGKLFSTNEQCLILQAGKKRIELAWSRIRSLEYGQKVDRRYLEAFLISPLFLLAKKREHFLTLHFQDEAEHAQALVFQIHKSDVRGTLAALEARTGLRVNYTDEEARRTGH